MRVDVARRNGRNADRRGQLPQHRVATSVAALERTLKLDEEPIAPKGLRQTRRGVRIPHREPMPCAARQADETLVAFLQQFLRERRVQQLALSPGHPRVGMRRGQQPAEVRVAGGRLDEQRHVRPLRERHLCAGDRPNAERLSRLRELERAVDPVVVGQRERAVAELGRPERELLGQRGAVQERIG